MSHFSSSGDLSVWYLEFFKFTLPKHMPPMSMMLNGYFGYDSIRYIEKIPDNCKDDLKIPDIK